MEGIELTEVQEEKDIGIILSNNLKPSRQCSEAARKARTVLLQIAKVFHYRDKVIFKRLYVQYVRPHLEYAITVWNPWSQGDIDTLENVQRKAVGMISGLNGKDYYDRLKELDLESLADRRVRFDMLQVYKILNRKDAVEYNTWFKTYGDSNHRPTRLAEYHQNLVREKSAEQIYAEIFSVKGLLTLGMICQLL